MRRPTCDLAPTIRDTPPPGLRASRDDELLAAGTSTPSGNRSGSTASRSTETTRPGVPLHATRRFASPSPRWLESPTFTYRVLARLGSGGMSEVFAVRRASAGVAERTYALKRLRPDLRQHADRYVPMMIDEAYLGSLFDHPGLCAVHDAWWTEDDCHIVSDRARGPTLAQLLSARKHCEALGDPRIVAGVLVQLCEALHHVHELADGSGRPLRVVHRDVSPSNLVLTFDGTVKLFDFGVAVRPGGPGLSGRRAGKWAYMAPEQVAGAAVDRRADLYAAALVAAELAVGRPLLPSTRAPDHAGRARRRVAAYVRRRVPLLGPVLARALSVDADDRFADARCFEEALVATLRRRAGPATARELANAVTAAPPPVHPTARGRSPAPRGDR